MSKISCDICLELIPLVKDGAASQDSAANVTEHISECADCYSLYNEQSMEKTQLNGNRVVIKIKKHLFKIAIIIIIIGLLVGVGLSESMGMFYNVLILPTIGVIGFWALRKKSFWLPIAEFALVYIWHFVKYLIDGMAAHGGLPSVFLLPALWAIIYSIFCAVGIVIGFLLYIAFRREKTNEKVD